MKKTVKRILVSSLMICAFVLMTFGTLNVHAAEDEDVLTYRLTIDKAPGEVQGWVNECSNLTGIYITESNGRYWVYTNAMSDNSNYSFNTKSDNGVYSITIVPNNYYPGDGYALISIPLRYTKITARCGSYVTEINK